jgi:non-ribosomal peptide synthetase-like protein
LRGIASTLDQRHAMAGGAAPVDLTFTPPPFYRRFLCGFAQLLVLPIILSLATMQWLGVFISYMLLTGENAGFFKEAIYLMALYALINFGTIALCFATKWLVLGRAKPGRYPLWGVYHFRIWVVQRLMTLTHIKWFQASPLMRIYLRMLGARIGKDAIISEVDIGIADLITIGDGACIGGKVNFANVVVVGNELIVGEIHIGADAYIGSSCVLEYGTRVEDGGELADLTSLAAGTVVGTYEKWDGSPGKKIGEVDVAALPEPATATPGRRRLHNLCYLLALAIIPPLGLLPIFPAFRLFDKMELSLESVFTSNASYVGGIFAIAWPASFAMVIFTIMLIAAVRWMLLPGRVREGRYSIHSWFYLRKWMLALTTEVTLETLSSLFATVYMRGWYRLMGARIGKGSEISTNLSGRYDLIEIGDKNFIADEVVMGDEDIRRGWMDLLPVRTGDRVFVGNDAVVAPGTTIAEGALIGVKSKPPATLSVGENETWFGSPPIKLPTRQRVDLGKNWTYEPSLAKKLMRAGFEALHISLPTALFITLGSIAIEQFIGEPLLSGDWVRATAMFVATSVGICAIMAVVVLMIKWLMMGRYKPQMRPMWSFWAMKTEMVAVMYWGLAGRVFNDHLRGTPFLPMMLRLYGAKIGKGVYMDMTDITEFDCVTVGDFAALNSLCCLQTHLYEDRVMKIGRIDVGRGVVVGAGATVLYDTKVGDFARLGPLTLVMKGEHIPSNSTWGGSPAEPVVVHRAPAAATEAMPVPEKIAA